MSVVASPSSVRSQSHRNHLTTKHKATRNNKPDNLSSKPTLSRFTHRHKHKAASSTPNQNNDFQASLQHLNFLHAKQPLPERLAHLILDETHSNPGWSSSYMTSLVHTCGFPRTTAVREDFEREMVAGYERSALSAIANFDVRFSRVC